MSRPSIALCMIRSEYEGSLDRKKMSRDVRLAYEAFGGLKARSKKLKLPRPEIAAREFIAWWLDELKSFKGTRATCGRIDHSKGYSWENIEMQDMAENSREMARRTLANKREQSVHGKKVFVFVKNTNMMTGIFPSIRTAASFFKISQRQVQFLVRGKYKSCSLVNFDLRCAA